MTSRGLDVLTSDECLALLRRNTFGRVGVKIAEDMAILPVYYASAGDEIVFRTDPGTKLIAAVLDTKVAFEVDDEADGWSVLVVGHAHEIRVESPDSSEALERLDGFWPDGNRDRIVRIEIERVTGRRLQRPV